MDRGDRVRNLRDRLRNFVFAHWFDFYKKHFRKITIITAAVLLCSMILFGWMSSREIRDVAVNQFNRQQLVLARYAVSQIENNFDVLERELSLLSISPLIQYPEVNSMWQRIAYTYRNLYEEGLREVRFMELKQMKLHLVDRYGYHSQEMDAESHRYLEWGGMEKNRDRIKISYALPSIYKDGTGRLLVSMLTPVWQGSLGKAQPLRSDLFTGVLIFIVDATTLIENATKGIMSGTTGYSWTIDRKGTFLYHPERSFIGKNAFEARKERKPSISFARINEIQKEMILTGKEGMSWYISGWHLGKEGEIKKLIAYAPLHLTIDETPAVWSIAVIAPISEVEGAIRGIQVRQDLLEGTGIVIILLAGFFLLSMMIRWSGTIRKEVDEKTAALKIREHQYQSLVEHADDIIFTVSPGGLILSMNSYGFNFLKKSKNEILSHSLRDLFPPESADLLMEVSGEVFRTNMSRQVACSIVIEEIVFWLNINFSSLVDGKGNVNRVLGIGRDITERKKMEAQMFHTEKLASLGTLAAGVAHEINNPLAVILGFTDMLIEQTPPDSDAYDLLKTIEKQGLNAKRVVENLLTFSRYKEHQEEEVDINANIEEIINVVNNTMKLNKVSVIMDMTEDLPRVRCEPREIQQVIFNIINNAIAVMKGGGVLTIETRALHDGQSVEIRITDTGAGIKKEHRTQIFDPLFTTKKVGEGTGLGLSVSYGIITKYGGTITFETRTPEESEETGTTFIITLPSVKKFDYEPCWEVTSCPEEWRSRCSAYKERMKPCWELNKMFCKDGEKKCEDCAVFLQRGKALSKDAHQQSASEIPGGVSR